MKQRTSPHTKDSPYQHITFCVVRATTGLRTTSDGAAMDIAIMIPIGLLVGAATENLRERLLDCDFETVANESRNDRGDGVNPRRADRRTCSFQT